MPTAIDGTYKRWKYMVKKGIDVPIAIDKIILDRMQGNDDGHKYPLDEMIAPHITEDLTCYGCGEPSGIIWSSMRWKEFVDHIAPFVCWVPPICDNCKDRRKNA